MARGGPGRGAGPGVRDPHDGVGKGLCGTNLSDTLTFSSALGKVSKPYMVSKMTYPQSTLEEIVDSERTMILDAPKRYGQHYAHARATTVYLTLFVESIELDRAETFGRLLSLMKKHHTLSVFSALRLHKVQAMMNLRQVLEAGAAAAFAIANPETHHFVDIDAFGIMDPAQKLTTKRYNWLDKNYPSEF